MGGIAFLLPILLDVLKTAPTVIEEAPAVIKSVKQVWKLATAKEAPTDKEKLTFHTALDTAHAAVQDL